MMEKVNEMDSQQSSHIEAKANLAQAIITWVRYSTFPSLLFHHCPFQNEGSTLPPFQNTDSTLPLPKRGFYFAPSKTRFYCDLPNQQNFSLA